MRYYWPLADLDVEMTREGELWVATDMATRVTSQGATPVSALTNLEQAVKLYRQPDA